MEKFSEVLTRVYKPGPSVAFFFYCRYDFGFVSIPIYYGCLSKTGILPSPLSIPHFCLHSIVFDTSLLPSIMDLCFLFCTSFLFCYHELF